MRKRNLTKFCSDDYDMTKPLRSYDVTLERLERFIWSVTQGLEKVHGELARQRNSRAAVHKLPDDVLRTIFIFCCERGRKPNGAYTRMSANDISGVCSRWYSVAMDNAEMWSSFDLDIGISRARPFFERSRGYEKRITFTEDAFKYDRNDRNSASLQLLGEYMESVVELDFTLAMQASPVLWLKNELPSAPVLHTLSISCLLDFGAGIVDLRGFDKKAPQLRNLNLAGVPMIWVREAYRNLTVLRISDCVVGTSEMFRRLPYEDDIFAPLRNSPQLHELEFSLWNPETFRRNLKRGSTTTGQQDVDNAVHLRSLRVLRLSFPSPYLCYILRTLHIPEHLDTLDLTVCHSSRTRDHIFQPDVLSSSFFQGTSLVQFASNNAQDAADGLRFSGFRRGTPFEVNISWTESDTDSFREVFDAIIEHYPLPSVRSFVIVTCKDPSDKKDLPPNLAAFMAHLPNLSCLKVTAAAHHHSWLIGKMALNHYPRLTSIEMTTSPTTLSTWLPSLKNNCTNLASFVITFEPVMFPESSSRPGTPEEQPREELEQASGVHKDISIYGYANKGCDHNAPKLVRVWPPTS